MALKVQWTALAVKERDQILSFYQDRNGNAKYSRELNRHFKKSMGLVAANQLMGKATDWPGVRYVNVMEYSLLYQVQADTLIVLSVWDNRRDPDKRSY